MIRNILFSGLIGLAVVSGLLSAPTDAIAQDARLDLAAMALDQADIPPEYAQTRFDDEGYTPGSRMAAIQYADRVSAEELQPFEIEWFYSSTYFSEDESSWILVYLTEYRTETAVEAGFAYFEDEERDQASGIEAEDQPGPAAGELPKEITAGTDDRVDPPVQFVDATFRVDRVLAGVTVSAPDAAPSGELVEELAARLEQRITAVLSGQMPDGIRPELPVLAMNLFATWPWPGNSLEGHKSAAQFLGAESGPAQFAGDYLGGYARFASAGSVEKIVQHEPPYIDLEIAEFAASDSALGMLEVAEELPTRHYGDQISRTAAPEPALAEVDGVRAFSTERSPIPGTPDSLHLTGYEIAFVVGAAFVAVTIQNDIADTRLTPEDLEATALDLAEQQVACLQQATECGPPTVPEPLSETGMPATPVAVLRA
jgi:hypothetical protein